MNAPRAMRRNDWRQDKMTDQQQRWIEELSHCSFYPGSWDKRFVRDLATFPPEQELSEKQAAALARVAWRYRKQRGEPGMAKPPGEATDEEKAKLDD
jgi:hypothetical protein